MWNRIQRSEYQLVLKHHWSQQRSALSYCLDEEQSLSRIHLQGGIAQTVHGCHIGRICKFYEFPFGRWSSQRLALKNNKQLTIITAYRPCPMVIDLTAETIVSQQFKAYKKKNIQRHPRI